MGGPRKQRPINPVNRYPGANYAAFPNGYVIQQGAGIPGNIPMTYAVRPRAQSAHQIQQALAQPRAQVPKFRYQAISTLARPSRPQAPEAQSSPFQTPPPMHPIPVSYELKLTKLPFYDSKEVLYKPASLQQTTNRFHENVFQFFLTSAQATDIASNRDIKDGSKIDYLYQIQLRFCPLLFEPNKEMSDEFPLNVIVQVNDKIVQLPNPINSNKPGVEPKRPPRPVNITQCCKLSPVVPNKVNVRWATGYGKGWVVAVFLVIKLTPDDLLDRLKKKGTREPNFTRNLIMQQLNNDDEVETSSLKVSVTCPLGKMRMKIPCRPSTCDHLQCFDGSTFLLMNERKPTWNCPVCDRKALYDDLLIDGYYQDILDSKKTIDEETVLLEKDGTWKPVPKEENKESDKDKTNGKSGNSSQNQSPVKGETPKTVIPSTNGTANAPTPAEIDCIDLSDDEEIPLPPSDKLPPLPPSAPPLPPPPPPPVGEIECIDLD